MNKEEFAALLDSYSDGVRYTENCSNWNHEADVVQRDEFRQDVLNAYNAIHTQHAQLVDSSAALNTHYTTLLDELQSDNTLLRALVNDVLHRNTKEEIIARDALVQELRNEILEYRDLLNIISSFQNIDNGSPNILMFNFNRMCSMAFNLLTKFQKEKP